MKVTATFKDTITQKPQLLRHRHAQVTSSFKDQLHLHWEIYPDVYECSGNNGLSAVIGERAYFQSGFVYEFNSSSHHWSLLPEHPLIGFSLVRVENELATVGGFNKRNSRDSNKLYSYI